MSTFNIVKTSKIPDSFKTNYVKSQFDLDLNEIKETFSGTIDLNFDWSVGVIVGASGTGKSTIAKEIFGEFEKFEYNDQPIIDAIRTKKNVSEITAVLNRVGFSSPPSWLKPYGVLSNGEKMRVDLAQALLSETEIIVFDEFTSVVDRQVAKIGSYAIQKHIKKHNDKKFVAVSCHYDVLEWLQPDWVFDTNKMVFFCQNTKDQNYNLKLKDANLIYGEVLKNIII